MDGARKNGRLVMTTSYVMAELVALLTRPMRVPRPEQIRIIETLRMAPWIHILHVDATQDAASWELLTSRPDKAWSLVDCSSFVIMKKYSLFEALTTDHHFEQAGFARLLKDS